MGATEVGPVERAIRLRIRSGDQLATPTQRKPFVVERVDARGVVLLFGVRETPTPLSWDILEGVVPKFQNKGWTIIGGRRDVNGNPGTLDEHMKTYMKRDTAGWVAALLEAAGIIEIDCGRPARFRVTN